MIEEQAGAFEGRKMVKERNDKQVCPFRMVTDLSAYGDSRSVQPCVYEKCKWYIGYPYFEEDCAFNQIAYALMALASFGPEGVREVS